MKRHQRIGMPVPQLVFTLEQGHLLHVLFVRHAVENGQSMRDGLTIGFLDGQEV